MIEILIAITLCFGLALFTGGAICLYLSWKPQEADYTPPPRTWSGKKRVTTNGICRMVKA